MQATQGCFDLVIKDPSSCSDRDLRLTADLSGTVLDVKRLICQAHSAQPQPAEQRLIFAGRLLKDEMRMTEVLQQVPLAINPPSCFSLTLPLTPPLPRACAA